MRCRSSSGDVIAWSPRCLPVDSPAGCAEHIALSDFASPPPSPTTWTFEPPYIVLCRINPLDSMLIMHPATRQLSSSIVNTSRRVAGLSTLSDTPSIFTGAQHRNKFANDTAKAGGDISDAFASMSGGGSGGLPPRYAALKKELIPTREAQESLVQTWRDVLREVAVLAATIRQKKGSVSPFALYYHIINLRSKYFLIISCR